MLKKILITSLFASMSLQAAEVIDDDDAETKGSKCKTLQNLNICNKLAVGGNETILGSITANSFTNPMGKLFSGFRNYAVLSNQAAVSQSTSGNTILWNSTTNNNLSSEISVNSTTGLITLPTSGTFFIEYSVRYNRLPPLPTGSPNTDTFVAQLQQTVAGVPTNITQPAITSSSYTDNVYADLGVPLFQPQITGYALITVSSAANNAIDLVVTFSGNDTMPAAIGTDANAEMVILQLN